MKTNFKQISLCDIYDDVKSFFEDDKPKFIKLFDSFINFSELIPSSFYDHYYSSPISRAISPTLSNALVVDTTGFEPYVKENNPKFFDSLYRNAKKLSKSYSRF
ncbi:hypothetical protein SAMN02746089_02782 [Caldanaerobius fijiensis DSM 17918]|uniref:Uncharacterized protein n=1 Tax=Caldanaerobius fijiensis DSM 17918 TaxID=1121256 RepID=A0A1M5FMG8_9THEO|nr:hypothetical protein SAMN02746089_02782 [Caldanaerobius fijiensis DSM 17918]